MLGYSFHISEANIVASDNHYSLVLINEDQDILVEIQTTSEDLQELVDKIH